MMNTEGEIKDIHKALISYMCDLRKVKLKKEQIVKK